MAHLQWPEIPDGRSGDVRVVHRALAYRFGDRVVQTGEEIQALEERRGDRWVCWMSTTIDELILHDEAVYRARGDVLVAGLGLGYFVHAARARPAVRSLTVVERSADVIALVWPYVGAGATLIDADIFDFLAGPPAARYDFVYADIWARVTPANLPDMRRLRGLAQPHLVPGGEVWYWGQELLQTQPQVAPPPRQPR